MHGQQLHPTLVRPRKPLALAWLWTMADTMIQAAMAQAIRVRRHAGRSEQAPQAHVSMAALLALAAAFLLPGLVGHDPWKQDETYIFGMIQHLLDSGDWVVPMVAGEPFMEKPPLYYWVAAGFASLLSPWLQLHDGARLATGFFMAVTCGALGWTVRHCWGPGYGRLGVLSLLGCLGTVYYSHLMLTDIPLLTGFALAGCGFALARTRSTAGGLLLGIGVGTGFLAKGVLAPAVLGLTALLLPACFANWRSRCYLRSLAVALLAALPALLIWPAALYLRSPALFMDWFWLNNVGRFLGFSVPLLGAPHTDGFWQETLPWFAFPALPLAMITLWRMRRTALQSAPIQFSLVLSGVLTAVLVASASARPNYALPLLAPLCVLAAPAVVALPAWAERLWTWGARLLFGALALAVAAIWTWMLVRGPLPEDWTVIGRYLPLDFAPRLNLSALAAAPLLVLVALAIAWRQPKTQGRGMVNWVAGVTLCWGLVATLWLDWIDTAKSYRSVFASMEESLPYMQRCMASSGLGESERAMLRYVLGIDTLRREIVPHADCDLLLINGLAEAPPRDIDSGLWKQVWEGARPSDRRERFWLYKKTVEASGSLAAVNP